MGARDRAALGIYNTVSALPRVGRTVGKAAKWGAVGLASVAHPGIGLGYLGYKGVKGGVRATRALRPGMRSAAGASSAAYGKSIGSSAFMQARPGLNKIGAGISRHPFLAGGAVAGMAIGAPRNPDKRFGNGPIGRAPNHTFLDVNRMPATMFKGGPGGLTPHSLGGTA